jgi:choline-glycine betaine transporter
MGCCGLFPNNSISLLSPLNGFIMWTALFAVVFCIINLFNKEKVPGEKEFSNSAFVNLLFTLGMGVGIMVYGFNEAPQLAGYSDVRDPIGLTLNHWICIPWCFYVMFAIFEIYNAKYNLLPKWLETVKTYVYGIMMMLGIGTSFALGVITISGSLKVIYGVDVPSYALVVILGAAVTVSLMLGIHKGMKNFAKVSMWLLYSFIGILVVISPMDTLQVGVKSIGSFFSDFLYNNIYTGRSVQVDWTVFYWIWWLSWCAFCAPFIVTISKGRTIREVVIYTVIVPSLLVAAYMILGNNFGMHLLAEGADIKMIPYLAINKHWILPVTFIILMSMFYITSSDSQSFSMDQLISKGSKTPVVYRKMLWVSLEVLFVTVLLLAGSGTVSAIQGLSFLFVPLLLIFMLIYLVLITRHLIKVYKKHHKIFNVDE